VIGASGHSSVIRATRMMLDDPAGALIEMHPAVEADAIGSAMRVSDAVRCGSCRSHQQDRAYLAAGRGQARGAEVDERGGERCWNIAHVVAVARQDLHSWVVTRLSHGRFEPGLVWLVH